MLERELHRRVTVAEAEAENLVEDERIGADPVPFGLMHQEWREFVEQMIDGDELWEFSTSPESWENLAGAAGYALVRDGKIMTTVTTIEN